MVLNEGFLDKMKSRFSKKPQPKKIKQPETSMSEHDKEVERIKDKYGLGDYAQLSPHDLIRARNELKKQS
jgi:Zn-finger nucleic acid-binding protein